MKPLDSGLLQGSLCVWWRQQGARSGLTLLAAVQKHTTMQMAHAAGISVDASRHVSLAGCWVRTADDALVVKSSASTLPPTLNITATSLTLQSRSAAIRVSGMG
jgi:hypothetical protein